MLNNLTNYCLRNRLLELKLSSTVYCEAASMVAISIFSSERSHMSEISFKMCVLGIILPGHFQSEKDESGRKRIVIWGDFRIWD